MKKFLIVFLSFASPLSAQCLLIPNGDTRALVWSRLPEAWPQTAEGRAAAQQALEDAVPFLNRYGIALTPENAEHEKTKIGDPLSLRWTRLGFGEGHPVWIPQGDVYAFNPAICGVSPAPTPIPIPVPQPAPGTIDYSAQLTRIEAKVDAVGDKVDGVGKQVEQASHTLRDIGVFTAKYILPILGGIAAGMTVK